MKTASLFAAISLALSVAASPQGNRNNNNRNVGNNNNRGGFNNNGNQGGFFGQGSGGFGGKNGNQQQQQQQNNNGKAQTQNTNKGNQNTNTGKGAQNTNTGKGNTGAGAGAVTATAAAAASATAAAAATASSAASSANTGANNANNGAAAGNAAGNNGENSANAQTSTTLDPGVIAAGFENDGQDVPTAGQVASLTSSNNFINFCLTVPNLPITNGKQVATGSCNPAPMGVIPSSDNMPSAKFVFPLNGDTTIKENTAFTIQMAVANFETGNFVNAAENYFSAPQQVNGQGQIIGHSHVVVEPLTALDQTTPTDPKKFVFFKGLNAAAVNGVLTADVTAGLPAGFYKLSSINTAANHQPVLVPIAQHGSLDDAVYFTVTANGAAAAAPAASAAAAATAAAAPAAAASGAAVAVTAPPVSNS
ncbi:hypothetical protein B0H34DRAFT_34183 [Crassisporium funariophilum]|nr:hypothetical protein B0H34DRAFT_34183 [Crassisporium funariophilum]